MTLPFLLQISGSMVPWIALGVAVLFVFWMIGIWNGLVRARNESKNAWAQIDVQLKRRHDLIPNLIETAKGYMKHEKDTLERIVQARNLASAARGPADAGKAEGQLGTALSGFFAIAEQYPDLKANSNFLMLQEELASTENKIGFARQAYNDAATRYNNARETFPANLVSGSFQPAELFELKSEVERAVPKVQF